MQDFNVNAASEKQHEIFDRVCKVLKNREYFTIHEDKEISMDSKLYEDLNLDSLDIVELEMACESEFDIWIPGEKGLDQAITVNDVVNTINSLIP